MATDITPRGPQGLAAIKLRRMLSLSREWQIDVGADSAEQAATRIHTQNAKPDWPLPRPFAILDTTGGFGYHWSSGGSQEFLLPRGELAVYVTRSIPPDLVGDPLGAELDAVNVFGSIHRDVILLSGADDPGAVDGESHLRIVSSDVRDMGRGPEELVEQLGHFMWQIIDFTWRA